MASNENVDKVQQAEWKLQGLCQLCGAKQGPYALYSFGDDDDDGAEMEKYNESACLYKETDWGRTNELCKDKIEYDGV